MVAFESGTKVVEHMPLARVGVGREEYRADLQEPASKAEAQQLVHGELVQPAVRPGDALAVLGTQGSGVDPRAVRDVHEQAEVLVVREGPGHPLVAGEPVREHHMLEQVTYGAIPARALDDA